MNKNSLIDWCVQLLVFLMFLPFFISLALQILARAWPAT